MPDMDALREAAAAKPKGQGPKKATNCAKCDDELDDGAKVSVTMMVKDTAPGASKGRSIFSGSATVCDGCGSELVDDFINVTSTESSS